jgi:hypothetical protein
MQVKLSTLIATVKHQAATLRAKAAAIWTESRQFLICSMLMSIPGIAQAQQAPGTQGICKMTTYLSDYVLLGIMTLAIVIYSIAHMVNASRENSMETVIRVTMAGSVGLSALSLAGFIFNKTAC